MPNISREQIIQELFNNKKEIINCINVTYNKLRKL